MFFFYIYIYLYMTINFFQFLKKLQGKIVQKMFNLFSIFNH